MSAGIDDRAVMKILRLEEELMVHAVARAQNGTVIEDVMFDWEVGMDADTVDDDPSDDTMSNMVSAEVAGTTTITVTAVDHNVAAELDIEVTAKAGKVTLMEMGATAAFEAADSYFPGDVVSAKLEAIPDVKHRAGSSVAWSSDDASVAKVETAKDKLGNMDNPNTRYAKITAVAAGTATITAMYEGKKASFDVVVSGPRNNRILHYILSANTFTYKLASTSPVIAAVDWAPATIVLEVTLEDADGDPLVGKTVSAVLNVDEAATTPVITSTGTNPLKTAAFVASGETASDGTVTFSIAAPDSDGSAKGDTNYTVTLSTPGAPDVPVRITASVVQQ